MGWFSGKQPVFKFNPLKINRAQQVDFLKSHLKMSEQQIDKLKEKAGEKGFLQAGKTMTESQLRKVLKENDKKAADSWSAWRRQKDKEYDVYKEEVRLENVKKTQKLDRRKESADAMIRKLTGRDESVKERLKKRRPQTEVDLTAKEKRVEAKHQQFINRSVADWRHAGPTQLRSIYETKAKNDKGQEEKEKSGDDDFDDLREASKNLPDLQI